MQQKTRYFYLAIFFLILYLSFLLLKPFMVAILASFVATYLVYPVYKGLNMVIKNKGVCAAILLFLIFVIILIPSFFIAERAIGEAANFYHKIVGIDFNRLSETASRYTGIDLNLDLYARDITSKAITLLLGNLSEFALSIPKKAIVVFISLFLMYYLLKEGDNIVNDIKKYLPLKEKQKEELIGKMKGVTWAVIYGVVVTAILQGIIGAIGLYIFKVHSPILLGLIMIVAAMMPYFGTAIVWLPAALIKLLNGDLFNGIGLLVYGVLVISLVDNFIRPMIISRKSRVHPLVIILGVFGGLSLFGFMGILVGPLILAVLIAFLDFYVKEYEA